MIDLTIILPVHNEAEGIRTVIDDIISVMKKTTISYEIVCIENGSRDDSLAILKNIEKKNIQIRVFQSEKGWGNAVWHGVNKAGSKYLCYLVSDGQIDPSVIPILYKTLLNSSLAMVKIRRITRENTKRFVNSFFYNFLARMVFGLPTMDVNGTPKLLKTSLIKKLNLQSHNIAIDLELLVKLKANSLQWKEIPVISKKRDSGSSSTNLKSVVEMLSYMKQFYFQKSQWKNIL